MTDTGNALISGASIAGPALAYWLRRAGWRVTVVERAPGIRPGGQAVDVRGPALDVVDRMGLLGQVRAGDTAMRGMAFVDDDGNELFRTTEETLTGGAFGNNDVEILRDDLVDILYRATRDGVEYLFDDSITALDERDGRVRVGFERAAPRTFDLVVGADGLHSNVRRLAFGPERPYLHHLGTYLAVFTTDNFLGLDHWQVFHQGPDRMSGLYSARDNTEARAVMGFAADVLDYDFRDLDEQRRILADRFTGAGWETPRLLKAMWSAPDFHFDSMSQVHLGRWSTGRVVLLGDAGYCGSPLSGQGTSMALVGAYLLADALATAADVPAALAAYEAELRPFAARNQQFAVDVSRWRETQDGPKPDIAEVSRSYTLPDRPFGVR